jgi:glycosyltransferase involved in cell wall biosynthesis
MKICYIVSTFPRFDGDPEVPWLLETVLRLRNKGVNIEIFAPSYQGIKSHSISEIPVHRFRYFFKRWEFLTHNEGATNKIQRTPLYNFLAIFYILFGVLSIIKLSLSKPYDHFEAHWPFPHALFAWIGAKIQRTSFSLRFYGAELILADRFPPVRPFLKFFMKRADTISAISTFTASKAKAIYDREIQIIPYGSPLQYVPDSPAEKQAFATRRILFVGRLVERKGVEYLVQAMPLVKKLGIDAHLTIVGNGHREKEIRESVVKSHAEDLVSLAGRVSEEEKTKLYESCDLYVHPAIIDSGGDTEMLGVVLLEAMAYKKPVIASNVGGIPDVIHHLKTGLLVPPRQPEALANAIVKVLSDREFATQIGEAGYIFSRDYFSWDRITNDLICQYNSQSNIKNI